MDNYRKCIFIDSADVIFSPDYFVLQFINKFRSIIKLKDVISYKRRIMEISNNKDILPMNNIKEKDGDLIITNMFDEEYKTQDEMLREFIKNKGNLYVFSEILKDIQKDYGILLNEVYPVMNMNMGGIYLQDSNFILFSNKYYDEENLLKHILPQNEHKRLVNKDELWKFFGTYTDEKRNIGIMFSIFTADTNIMNTIINQHKYILDWQVPLINMETLILSYTNNNLNYAKQNKERYDTDKNQEIFQTGVIDLWEEGIVSKFLRSNPYSIL